MQRNPNFDRLPGGYVFPEVRKRVRAFLEREPDADLISLGVGDTTEPLPDPIIQAMTHFTQALGSPDGYEGYGPTDGKEPLRKAIASRLYQGRVDADEVFVADGAKPILGRIQFLFPKSAKVTVQDPNYPVPADATLLSGHELTYLPCCPENSFFPTEFPPSDILYLCSPNNPTGTVATHEQLTKLVAQAKERKTLIVYDTAYAAYIQDDSLPKTIYEIPGAEEVAIEIGSFSKLVGFTGVRLGWAIIPKALKYSDGGSVHADYRRSSAILFNGASNIAQAGGLACLSDEGMEAVDAIINYYRANTATLREVLQASGLATYGGLHAPYLWIHFPKRDSWEVFDEILNETHLVTTPGIGFGPAGQGFIRMSPYGHHDNIDKAAERLKDYLGQM